MGEREFDRRQRQLLGQRLAKLRAVRGETQEDAAAGIAAQAGIKFARSTLAGIETGNPIGREKLTAAAAYYGVPIDDLLAVPRQDNAPSRSRFADRPDQVYLLDFWDALPSDVERERMLKIIQAAAPDTAKIVKADEIIWRRRR